MTSVQGRDDTGELLDRAGRGDPVARAELLERYRQRLRRMVAVRMNSRLTPRVDPSDIVQEAMGDASRHMDTYLRDRPLPVYLWLRKLAWERLIEARRRHIEADKRSVTREVRAEPEDSTRMLAERFVSTGTSASERMARRERKNQVLETLAMLPEADREVLVLIYLEGMDIPEIAQLLEITRNAASKRHTRALDRLRPLLDGCLEEDRS